MKEVIDELMAKFDTDGDELHNEFAEFVKPKKWSTSPTPTTTTAWGDDAEHAAKIKAAPLKPVKEATAAELEGYRAKLAEKIDEVQAAHAAFRDIDTDPRAICPSRSRRRRGQLQPGASARYGSTLRATALRASLYCPHRPPTPSCRHRRARRPADRQGRRHRPRRPHRGDEFGAAPRARGRGHRQPGRRAARRPIEVASSPDDPMHAGTPTSTGTANRSSSDSKRERAHLGLGKEGRGRGPRIQRGRRILGGNPYTTVSRKRAQPRPRPPQT